MYRANDQSSRGYGLIDIATSYIYIYRYYGVHTRGPINGMRFYDRFDWRVYNRHVFVLAHT